MYIITRVRLIIENLKKYYLLYIINVLFNIFQLDKEPGNTQAQQHADLIEPLKQDIQMSRTLVDNREYQAALDTLTRAIEVCVEKKIKNKKLPPCIIF